MNNLSLTITSESGNIPKVENFIENLFNEFKLPKKLRGKITQSIIEAVNNAILHGNKQNPQKMVQLDAIKSYRKIIIMIEDEGEGFDCKNFPDPTIPNNPAKTAGRGLYLMRTLTDGLVFAKNGAKVVMIFSIINETGT